MRLLILTISLLAALSLNAQDAVWWEPEQPVQGGEVTIFYNTVHGSLPDAANPVNLHIGVNGWQEVQDFVMTAEGDSTWSHVYPVGDNVTIIDFVFFDNNGNWDNNGGAGIDYHISVGIPDLWSPPFPGPNDTIRISQQYTSQAWLWWGVNDWSAPIDDYWPEGTLIGEEGLSVDSPMNGPDSNGVYWIDIGPFNDLSQAVHTVDFVFHFDDGVWDNNDHQDYHIPIDFTPGPDDPSIEILNPAADAILENDQLVQVHAENSVYNEIRLDGETQFISTEADFEFTMNTDDLEFGIHELVAYSRHENGRVMFDFVSVWKIPELLYEPFPPYYNMGVHDQLDGTVSFSLLAPGKRFVALAGDFYDWDVEVMNYDSTQGIWWLNISLEPGTYHYNYRIDHTLAPYGDPLATDVDWTDEYGNETWQPWLQTAVVEIGGEEYPWTDADFQRPPMNELMIYELLLRDFTEEGTINAATERLDYLHDLGVNAIEFLPPTEFPYESSWGYNPAFFMAVESSYGTPEDMKNFVDQAHARGMAVLIDLVFNHCDGTAPYNWLYGNDYENSPYIHPESNAWGFPDFDHARVGTRQLVSKTVRHWISEYHIDGYRYDHTPGIGWSGLSDFGVSYFSYQAWLEDNDVYQIAEHFDNDIQSLISWTRIRSHWHDSFHDQMKANLREGPFEGSAFGDMNKTEDGIYFAEEGFADLEACVNYLESHDEQRVIFEAQTNGLSYEEALQKAKLGPAVLFTSAGIPMLYMGAEIGMDTERTLDHNPLLWHYLDDPDKQAIFQLYRKLAWLRSNYPALSSNNYNTVYKNSSQKLIVYHRTLDGSPAIVVVANFNSNALTHDVEFPWAGTWYEFIEDDTLNIESNWYGDYVIPGSSARIFASERLWLGLEDDIAIPHEFRIYPAYPNPFNPRTQINYDLPRRSAVHIQVFDLQGREVLVQSHTDLEPGNYRFIWDAVDQGGRPAAAGVYLVSIQAEEYHGVQKLLLMK